MNLDAILPPKSKLPSSPPSLLIVAISKTHLSLLLSRHPTLCFTSIKNTIPGSVLQNELFKSSNCQGRPQSLTVPA
ncbi:conserved hypothetical protein [Ricinus communis]|uniref:Uncharacterized protein n=1 Tax=Ricinus communis TaxID=3988 RepID=B9S6W3_RICCO|nr:conserved hypothetical protein [Ricinus communis]